MSAIYVTLNLRVGTNDYWR